MGIFIPYLYTIINTAEMETMELRIRKELKTAKLSYGSVTYRRVEMIMTAINKVTEIGFNEWVSETSMSLELIEIVKKLSK